MLPFCRGKLPQGDVSCTNCKALLRSWPDSTLRARGTDLVSRLMIGITGVMIWLAGDIDIPTESARSPK